MKSKKAIVIDAVLGSLLIFSAFYCVIVYYAKPVYACVCAALAAAALLVVFVRREKFSRFRENSSKRAADMFDKLMFVPPNVTLSKLERTLKDKGFTVKRVRNGLVCADTALFYEPAVDKRAVASDVALSGKHNAKRVIIVSETFQKDVAVFMEKFDNVEALSGEACFKLFASLNALPECEPPYRKKRALPAAIMSAFAFDKWSKYLLSGGLILALGLIGGMGVFYIVMASLCFALSCCCVIIGLVGSKTKNAEKPKNQK